MKPSVLACFIAEAYKRKLHSGRVDKVTDDIVTQLIKELCGITDIPKPLAARVHKHLRSVHGLDPMYDMELLQVRHRGGERPIALPVAVCEHHTLCAPVTA